MKRKSDNATINVRGTDITIIRCDDQDYISLTDMVRNFDGGSALIEQWLKNKDTVLFLGVWEQFNNPDFNSLEFEGIKNEAGRNSFYLSAKKWMSATGAQGLIAKAGRYRDYSPASVAPLVYFVCFVYFVCGKLSTTIKRTLGKCHETFECRPPAYSSGNGAGTGIKSYAVQVRLG